MGQVWNKFRVFSGQVFDRFGTGSRQVWGIIQDKFGTGLKQVRELRKRKSWGKVWDNFGVLFKFGQVWNEFMIGLGEVQDKLWTRDKSWNNSDMSKWNNNPSRALHLDDLKLQIFYVRQWVKKRDLSIKWVTHCRSEEFNYRYLDADRESKRKTHQSMCFTSMILSCRYFASDNQVFRNFFIEFLNWIHSDVSMK